MAGTTIAAIDMGSSKVCTAVANVSDGRVNEVLGGGEAPSRGIQKGIILDLDDAAMAVRNSLAQAQEAAGFQVTRALVGFSGKQISSTNPIVSVGIEGKDHLVTEATLREVAERVEAIQFPEDRLKINVVKRHYTIDRVGGIKNPLGMHGFRLDLEAHVVTADFSYVENRATCIKRAGVDVNADSFVANALASAEAVLEPDEKERGVILVDIGGGTTDLGVFRDGAIWYTAALPVGGRRITNDLAVGLDTSFSAAEEVKLAAGALYPPEEVSEKSKKVLDKRGTSPEEVSYIIRARVEELLRMVVSKTPYVPSGIVITGGTANMPGMEQFAGEVLGMQVRIGLPVNLPPGAESFNGPAYSAIMGLLQWGAQKEFRGDIGRAELGGGLGGFVTGLRSALGSAWNSRWRPRIALGAGTTESKEKK